MYLSSQSLKGQADKGSIVELSSGLDDPLIDDYTL